MKQTHTLTIEHDIPLITARLIGRGVSCSVKLVFDTGAATTQIHTPVIDSMGYSAADGTGVIESFGPAGPMQRGYSLQVDKLRVLGREFSSPHLSVYDFDNYIGSEIDGLLGFDIIRQLHFEMNGPRSELSLCL